jgi:hypothetical protein
MTHYRVSSFCPVIGVALCVCGSASCHCSTNLLLNNDAWIMVKWWHTRKLRYSEKHVSPGQISLRELWHRLLNSFGALFPGVKAVAAWFWSLASISCRSCGWVQLYLHCPHVSVACTGTALPLCLSPACSTTRRVSLHACEGFQVIFHVSY